MFGVQDDTPTESSVHLNSHKLIYIYNTVPLGLFPVLSFQLRCGLSKDMNHLCILATDSEHTAVSM